MKVRNKITGIVSTERSDIAGALIRQGLCEAVTNDGSVEAPNIHGTETYKLPRPGDAHIPEPAWDVVEVTGAQSFVAIQMTIGSNKYLYAGRPELVNTRREWDGGGRYLNTFGRAVPQEIADRYAKACKKNPNLCAFEQPMNSVLAGASGGAAHQNQVQAEVQAKLQAAEKKGERLALNRPAVLDPGDHSTVIWEGSRQ